MQENKPFGACMYMNEHRQMCGPYAPKQLYEGLSTGFLPQELAIYALVDGKMGNPVPLSLLEQFLSQWNSAAAVSTPNETKDNKTVAPTDKMALQDVISSDEPCWMFEDAEGCRHGPYSFAELSYWHHSSYLQDLSMVKKKTSNLTKLSSCLPQSLLDEPIKRVPFSGQDRTNERMQPMNILGTKPADPLTEIIPTGSTSKQQQEGMSGVGSSTPDANAWSFPAGMSWGTPPTEPLSMAPSMAQYLSHEMLPIGNYKHSCAAELWRVLADLSEPLLSIPPAAVEELRRIHRGVTESSARAKERAKALHGYIQKLEKYQSDLVWQRQRTRLGFHHRMTFQELRRITDGFSEKRVLGKGGFGMVYRGVLDDGDVIAVKKLNPQQGLTGDSFRNEIQNLMRVQHQNIISLVGYCEETRDRVVEYEGKLVAAVEIDRAICLEYMQGGTLEKLLSDESSGLDWEARYRIIKGTCQGLQHLHTGSENPIYHLDLNPANILLDKDQIPKIGDFGLSRLLASPATFVTKTNSGTLGYMPPEYMHGQQISSKFDVFSLGIVIIKVIAGPDGYFKYKCIYTSPKKFMDHVTQNWSKRVQARKMSAVSLQKVKKCIKMALRCVEDDRAKRPTITEIVKELNMIS